MPLVTKPEFLDAHHERVISVRAVCDPRSVRKYLKGEDVLSTVRARIEDALRAEGFEKLVRKGDA